LASKTSNAKPYAIRRRFSHRKRSAIRRKPAFSGLFAVSRYHQGGFRAKIPQRSKVLFEKIALFAYPNTRRGGVLGGRKAMHLIQRVGISAAALVVSSAAIFAAPALVLSDLNMRAGPGTNSPVVITVPGGSRVDVLGCDASGWCSVRYGRFGGL
jgi:Bacterial SH3 domain